MTDPAKEDLEEKAAAYRPEVPNSIVVATIIVVKVEKAFVFVEKVLMMVSKLDVQNIISRELHENFGFKL